jgi:hypothetical protein
LRRQIVLKETAGVVRVGESGFEEFVVRVMDGFLQHAFLKRVAVGGEDRRQALAEESQAQD